MRVLDIERDRVVKNLGLYLTHKEARQMLGYPEGLRSRRLILEGK
jgi:hypothetical protein